jgi:NAD(P)-dependent dehydrogenase (short-subunit alcohol dehydrogenase family)
MANTDKIIVISGGSEGLGRAMAEEFSRDNRVIILSNEEEKLKQAAKEIGCDYEFCDVADYELCEKAIKSVIAKHGRIDCLINNAGIYIRGPLEENDPQRIRRVIEVNTLGTIFLSRATIPYMKERKKGMIINIISQAGFHAKAERAVYYSSKWAITGFTKCLQCELASLGIKVCGFYPGNMKTKFHENAGIKNGDYSKAFDPKEAAKLLKSVIELGDDIFVPELGLSTLKGYE